MFILQISTVFVISGFIFSVLDDPQGGTFTPNVASTASNLQEALKQIRAAKLLNIPDNVEESEGNHDVNLIENLFKNSKAVSKSNNVF